MMTRREFVAAAMATGAVVGIGGCRSARGSARVDARLMAELIDAQIRDGLLTCAACGSADGVIFCRGNRLPQVLRSDASTSGDAASEALNSESSSPVGATSIFEIASLSKLFTATLAAILAAEGKIDVDAPFVKYLPDHALAKSGTDITVRDLATHTSGFDDSWMCNHGIYTETFPFACDADYRRSFLQALPTAKRGERYCYACHNFILLGWIVNHVTGLDLDAAARRYIWGPLAMHDTSWTQCVDLARCVQIYTHGPRPLGTKGDENARGLHQPIGNAGVFSTLNDLCRFAADLRDRRAFGKFVYDLLFTPTAVYPNGRRSFGFNMSLDGLPPGWSERTIFHTGYTGQLLAVDPESGKAGVVLTNLIPSDPARRRPAYGVRRQLLSLVCTPRLVTE